MPAQKSNRGKGSPKKKTTSPQSVIPSADEAILQKSSPHSVIPSAEEALPPAPPPVPTVSPLSIEEINPLVKSAQYAVRGRLLDVAKSLEDKLASGETLPFTNIVRCNIGNPQALGQRPLTFVRQTLSLLLNPGLRDAPEIDISAIYPADVLERAASYAGAVPSVGAYSDSQGIRIVREHVAEFIGARDGCPASADDIFLTDGASAGVKALMTMLLRGPQDAVLCPIPQYPLYSATTTLLNATLAGYYLDESNAWGITEDALLQAVEQARAGGATPRALVVINPGNPTGQSLPKESVEMILRFAAKHKLVLMADEVYQENVYGDAPPFYSFKKALSALRECGAAGDAEAAEQAASTQLVSFHSTSKGFIGECGLRGGYFELQNVPLDVRAQLLKLMSINLCSNVVGQFATGLMVRPPVDGQPSFEKYTAEREAILQSLYSRAQRIAAELNTLPGFSCNAAEGAMYLFPSVALTTPMVEAAAAAGMAADEWYCIQLLEATGLVVVPGSGFGQKEGTFHFRTTFLPPEDAITEVLAKLKDFQAGFMQSWATQGDDELALVA